MIEILSELFANKIFVSALLAYIAASTMKIMVSYLLYHKIVWKFFFRTGGMPSSHAAVASAMTTSVFIIEGVSNLFIVSFIMSMVIVADAVGIRRAAGRQAEILNKMIDEFTQQGKIEASRLYELLGHSPKQVFVGMIVGLLVAQLVFML